MSNYPAIEDSLVEILGDVLETAPAAIRATPVLAAHRWDSLATLEALAQLEDVWGVTLDLRSYNAAHTLDELVALVAQSTGVSGDAPS